MRSVVQVYPGPSRTDAQTHRRTGGAPLEVASSGGASGFLEPGPLARASYRLAAILVRPAMGARHTPSEDAAKRCVPPATSLGTPMVP